MSKVKISKNKTLHMSNDGTIENESKRKEEPPSPTPSPIQMSETQKNIPL
jgi:hypothetical protein